MKSLTSFHNFNLKNIFCLTMASDAVFKYLVDTNRPYSCADVTVNLRGAFPKSAIQKALDALSESGKIKCKLYGKQKVFAAIQPETVVGDDDTIDYEAQLKEVAQNLADKTSTLRTAESNLKCLTSTPTNEVATTLSEEVRQRINAMEAKLETLRSSTEVLSTEEKNCLMSEHDKLLKEYRKRKRIFSDMIEAMLEGYPKSKKTFLEELCIETDEMVNFKLISS